MDLLIHRLLDDQLAKKIHNDLISKNFNWEDGRKTAGTQAAKVKSNLQLDSNSKQSMELEKIIIEKINKDQLIKSFALPKNFHGIRFARTCKGQRYGMHVDNAFMSTGRSDLSFTIFLNDSKSYEGGELCIQSLQETKKIKLSQGEIVIYPSTTLHSVEEVTRGERIVCIGWIESYITSSEDRNLLFGLDAGAKGLLATYGQSDQLNLVFQAYNNLLRRLGA